MKYLLFISIILFNSCGNNSALESKKVIDYIEDQDALDPNYCEAEDVNDDHFRVSKVTWQGHHADKNFQIFRKPITSIQLTSYIAKKMQEFVDERQPIAGYRKISTSNPWKFQGRVYTDVKKYIRDFSKALAENILAATSCFGLDPYFYTALIQQESMFNIRAKSPTGAVGLTQFTTAALRDVTWHTREVRNTIVERSIATGKKYTRDQIIYNYNRRSSTEVEYALNQNLYKIIEHNHKAKSCMERRLGNTFPYLVQKIKNTGLKPMPLIRGLDERQASDSQFRTAIGNKMKKVLRYDLNASVYYGASFLNLQFSKSCFKFDLKNFYPEKDPRSCSSLFINLKRCDKNNFSGRLRSDIVEKALRAYNGASVEEQLKYVKRITKFSKLIYDSIN